MATERVILVFEARGTRRAERGIRNIGKASKRATKDIGTLRTGLGQLRALLVAVAAAAVIGRATKGLLDFGQAMSTVRAVTGATVEQFESFQRVARDLGATTRFTATQAAEGMVALGRAGFGANRILANTDDVLLLAQAGALELGRAADIASNILKGFNATAAETPKIVDVLALAANSANTTVEQLGDAMSFVAPVSVTLGISIERTTAALQALAEQSVRGSRAGTALRTVLIRLEKAGGEFSVQQRGLIPVLEDLRKRNLQVTDAAKLVGIRQAANLIILIRSIDAIKEFARANEEAAGSARKMADIMDDNVNGAFLRLKSSAEAILLSLGEVGGTSALTGVLDRLTGLFRLVAFNADILAKALLVLAAIVGGKLLIGGLRLLIALLIRTGAAMLALSVRFLPVLAATAAAAFITIAAVAAVQGRSIESVFDDIRSGIETAIEGFIGLGDSLLKSVETVNAFEARIGSFVREIKELGGISELTEDQVKDLIDRIIVLRDEVSARLALQQFLAPESEGVKQMTDQVRVLNKVLDAFRSKLAEGEDITTDTRDPLGGGLVDPNEIDKLTKALRNLEGQVSPLLALQNEMADSEKIINDAVAAGIKLRISQAEILRRVEREQLGVGNAVEEAAEKQELLNDALARGIITMEEFRKASRDLRIDVLEDQRDLASGVERTFLKLQDSVEDTASAVEELLTDAFKSAEDALVEFVQTGKISIADLGKTIQEQLLRQAFRGVTANLGAGLGFGQGTQGGLISSLFGGAGGVGGGGEAISGLSGLFGFQKGIQGASVNSLSVGRLPGVDNRLVAFRARGNETVDVNRRGEGGQQTVIHFTVNAQDVNSFNRSQPQILSSLQTALARANARNN